MTPNKEFPNLELARAGISAYFNVKLRNLEFRFRPLSILEENIIAEQVLEEMGKIPESKRTSIKESTLLSLKKLEMAQTSDVGIHDPKVYAVELGRLPAGDIDFLFKEYVAGCDKRNPRFDEIPMEMIEKWIATLKKSSNEMAMILTELSFFQLAALSRHLLTQGESPKDN